jgi:hypothetical protein
VVRAAAYPALGGPDLPRGGHGGDGRGIFAFEVLALGGVAFCQAGKVLALEVDALAFFGAAFDFAFGVLSLTLSNVAFALGGDLGWEECTHRLAFVCRGGARREPRRILVALALMLALGGALGLALVLPLVVEVAARACTALFVGEADVRSVSGVVHMVLVAPFQVPAAENSSPTPHLFQFCRGGGGDGDSRV